MLLRVELVAPREVNSQRRAWRTDGVMGRNWWRDARVVAQVRTVHQLHQALRRVAGAVPRGAMTVLKALLISMMVEFVAAAREGTTGAQLPAEPSRGDPVEPLWRAAAEWRHMAGRDAARRSWIFRTVATQQFAHWGCSLLWAARARSTEAR